MPIAECPACSKMMSTQSRRCPHCGYEPPKPSVLGLKLLLVLLVAIGGGTYVALQRSPRGREALQTLNDFAHSEVGVAPKAVEAEVPVMLDVTAVAGKSTKEVAKALGPAFRRETATIRGKRYPSIFYREGQVQVVFVDGKADWITLYHANAVPFTGQAIRALGLPPVEPTVRGADVIKWQDVGGIREVSVFPTTGGAADYVSILVRTEP